MQQKRGGGTRRRTAGYGRDPQSALRKRQYPFELSGGMRQRVVLAIALACEPDLIMRMNRQRALDALVQAQILLLFKRIVRETETSMLLVSHDMGVTCRHVQQSVCHA